MKWLWIYRGDPSLHQREDQLHMFPEDAIPLAKKATPVVPLAHAPACKTELGKGWQIFNLGGGDARRLAAIAGNNLTTCEACNEIERNTPT